VLCIVFAHEVDRIAVVVIERDVFLGGELSGDVLVPFERFDQVAFWGDSGCMAVSLKPPGAIQNYR
jgi:hypothetical protein